MSYRIISNFIKDISFEIPDTQTMLFFEKNLNNYDVKIDLKGIPIKDNIIQVDMVLQFHNTKDIKDKALIEITYATLITIEDVKDKKILQKIILVEVPTEVYPKVFEIFSFLLSHSGLPKMSIKKDIDFNKLYDELENRIDDLEAWPQSLGCHKEEYHSNSFEVSDTFILKVMKIYRIYFPGFFLALSSMILCDPI